MNAIMLARTRESPLALVLEPGLLAVGPAIAALAEHDPQAAALLGEALGADGSWTAVIERWELVREPLATLADLAVAQPQAFALTPIEPGVLLAPLPSERARIFALGSNFARHLLDANTAIHGARHARELLAQRRASGPSGFHVLADTVVGPEAEIRPPAGIEKLDYEGEVAVILARGGRAIEPGDVATSACATPCSAWASPTTAAR
jgi:2-keto-4-pentenoate hydratase/2-oxohepta-3-ene-1,7-dioic acid hydratase in catechol pathway